MSEYGELYYVSIFIILALIQDEVKGVLSSVTCFIMVLMSKSFISASSTYGMSFFEAALAYDFLFFLAGMFLLGSKAGNYLILISLISFLVNTLSLLFYSDYREFIKLYYGVVNVLLFEILLYGHFTSTRAYPYIKSKFVKLEKWISEKLRSQHNNTAR